MIKIRNEEKEVDFQWFVVNFIIHWRWFVISIVLFLFACFLYLRYAVPIYRVTASIILQDSKRNSLVNGLSIFEHIGFPEKGICNINNEREIIHSRNLIENVVLKQKLFINCFIKGKFKNLDLYGTQNEKFYTSAPVKVVVDSTIITSLKRRLFLDVLLTNHSTINVSGYYGRYKFSKEYSSFPITVKTPIGYLSLLENSSSPLKKKYPLSIVVSPPLWEAQHYMSLLTIKLIDKTTIIQLSLKETHRRRGEEFLEKLITLYEKNVMNEKNKALLNISYFISERLHNLSEDLRLSKKRLEDYKRENHIANIEYESQVYVKEGNEYEKKLIQLETETQLLSYIENGLTTENLLQSISFGMLNGALSTNIDEYNRTLLEKERLLTYANTEIPKIKQLNVRISSLKEDIRTSIEALKYAISKQKKEYEKLYSKYLLKIQNIPVREQKLVELLRQQMIKANLYTDFFREKESIDMTMAVVTPNSRVLESPFASYMPIAPNKSLTYLFCLISGAIFPFIVVGVCELFNF